MLKHASPNFAPVFGEQVPFSPVLTQIDSEERLNLQDYEQSKAFTKAPGFFIRSGRSRPSSGRILVTPAPGIPRRKPESGAHVDLGSPRPSFSLLEKRMKLVQDHWKRKAYTKSPKQSLDLTEDNEIEESKDEILPAPDIPVVDWLGGSRLPSESTEREESAWHINVQTAETPTMHDLEETLSGMPSGIHQVEFGPEMRHRTQSGRDAEILMAGNDGCGTTVLVKYADSDALQLRSLKSIQRIL